MAKPNPYETFQTGPGDKPIAYVLVGLPASGKSTWARSHPQKFPIASSDTYIESYAKENDLSYDAAFKACYKEACADMKRQVDHYTAAGLPFIWDQVNLDRKERSQIYKCLEATHRVVYVCFRVPLEECIRRHVERARAGGAVVDEARIRMLARNARFPEPGGEQFYKLISLTHPGWGERKSA